jgi:peptide/nickel transport system ATP-binding protein
MADLLSLENVSQVFGVNELTYAVDGVSFTLPEQPTIMSLVGESGSGKSTIARIVLRLQKPTSGRICYMGRDLFATEDRQSELRFRREVQGVFQNPYSAFNPFYRVERVFTMAIQKLGLPIPRNERRNRIEEALAAVDLRSGDVLGKYPHQLSGGMRQRIMMARIHLIRPRLLIADEPVSMVDAGVRASFLNILLDFRDRHGISTLFITHDLSTAQYLGGQIIVLYKGRIVERGATAEVTNRPKHPYAQLLMGSIPVADPSRRWQQGLAAAPEAGAPVETRERCLYAERCPVVRDMCWRQQPVPPVLMPAPGEIPHQAACHRCLE